MFINIVYIRNKKKNNNNNKFDCIYKTLFLSYRTIITREGRAGVYYLETLHLKVSYVADGTSCKVLLITELLDRTWDENFNNWNVFYVNRFLVIRLHTVNRLPFTAFHFLIVIRTWFTLSASAAQKFPLPPPRACIKNALEDELNLAEVSLSVLPKLLLLCSRLWQDGASLEEKKRRCTYRLVYRLFFHFNEWHVYCNIPVRVSFEL